MPPTTRQTPKLISSSVNESAGNPEVSAVSASEVDSLLMTIISSPTSGVLLGKELELEWGFRLGLGIGLFSNLLGSGVVVVVVVLGTGTKKNEDDVVLGFR